MLRRITLAALLCLLPAGCRQNAYWDAHLELLQAERRALEDRVIDLEIDLEDAQKRLAEYQGEGETGGDGRGRGTSRGEEIAPPSITIPDATPGTSEIPDLGPPRVEQGVPDGFELELPPPRGAAREAAPQRPREPLSPRTTPALTLATRDPRITHLHLNGRLTGGTDFDHRPGDDGLLVVLEPRNADDQYVPLAGPVKVVVLDYAKRDQGAAAYVARWDLDAGVVDQALRRSESHPGIHLRLPWPDQPPEHGKLRLDVRYVTADGRKLDARQDLFLSLPGQFSTRWTPRSPRDGLPAAGGLAGASISDEAASAPPLSAADPPLPTTPATDDPPAATIPHTARPQWTPYR